MVGCLFGLVCGAFFVCLVLCVGLVVFGLLLLFVFVVVDFVFFFFVIFFPMRLTVEAGKQQRGLNGSKKQHNREVVIAIGLCSRR